MSKEKKIGKFTIISELRNWTVDSRGVYHVNPDENDGHIGMGVGGA